jgi:hypothetical protein
MADDTFEIGRHYSRKAIHFALGGSLIQFLPCCQGRVVAACLRTDINPRAPNVVLVGRGRRLEAAGQTLAAQPGAIPVFIRQRPTAWEYKGLFKVVQSLTSRADVAPYIEGTGQRDVAQVIKLAPAYGNLIQDQS